MARRIVALPLLALLATCQSTPRGGDWNQSIGKDWNLVRIGGDAVLEGTEIHLTFRGDYHLFGQAANRYVGRYTKDGPELKSSQIVATRGFLDEPPGAMAQETRYLKLLEAVDGYSLLNSGARLELMQGSRVTLAYVAAAEK